VESETLSNDMLAEISERCELATSGPWFVRWLDDTHGMSLITVSTVPGNPLQREQWPSFDSGDIVAATLVQEPSYAAIHDDRSDQNARFIAASRTDVPMLVAEVRRLRALLSTYERTDPLR
jgi:hypothetical protein